MNAASPASVAIDAAFRRRLREEFDRRAADGTLPAPLQRYLGEDSAVLARARSLATPASTVRDRHAAVRIRTVVNAFESPSLLIRGGSFEAPASVAWAGVLEPRRGALEAVFPAVGRIDVAHHPRRSWLGTGVLVAPRVVVTNRHVALEMAAREGEGWTFAPGLGGQRVAAAIDFREEAGSTTAAEFPLEDVLDVANAGEPDLAFLHVADRPGLPAPAPLGGAVAAQHAVAAVGYTSREPGMPPEVEEILAGIFGNLYDVKRLAPGRVLRTDTASVAHDCSTQGGNSGSALLDIATALVAGIHFEGGISENLAVPAEVVRERLERVA